MLRHLFINCYREHSKSRMNISKKEDNIIWAESLIYLDFTLTNIYQLLTLSSTVLGTRINLNNVDMVLKEFQLMESSHKDYSLV